MDQARTGDQRPDVSTAQDGGRAAVVAWRGSGNPPPKPRRDGGELRGWRDAFLAAGEAALATKPASGEALESDRLKAKLGAALIERDLLHEKIAILEANRPLARRKLRPWARPSPRLAAGPMACLRFPTKPATHSNRKPATDSDLKPAGIPI